MEHAGAYIKKWDNSVDWLPIQPEEQGMADQMPAGMNGPTQDTLTDNAETADRKSRGVKVQQGQADAGLRH